MSNRFELVFDAPGATVEQAVSALRDEFQARRYIRKESAAQPPYVVRFAGKVPWCLFRFVVDVGGSERDGLARLILRGRIKPTVILYIVSALLGFGAFAWEAQRKQSDALSAWLIFPPVAALFYYIQSPMTRRAFARIVTRLERDLSIRAGVPVSTNPTAPVPSDSKT